MSDSNNVTSQTAGSNAQKAPRPTGLRQKIFNAVGWLAFALLAPPVLTMFKLPQLQTLITTNMGVWGSPIALVIYFYVILFLRVFFGSDQRYTPVLLGYALSFLYFSIALDIGFMRWLYDLAHRVPFLSYDAMNLVAATVVIFLSNALSGVKKANWAVDVIVLALLPAGALVAAGMYLPGLLGF
jgi:hypothetical protein